MITMTRRITFSSGHRYWIPDLTEEENRTIFGQWASKFNHGHNYVLNVKVSGKIEPSSGMIVNIKLVDDILRETIKQEFDQKSINDEIEWFRSRSSCTENILLYIKDRLLSKDALTTLPVQLEELRLEETPLLWAELNLATHTMTLTRVYEFAASHRLNAPTLSHEENLRLFGKCNNPAGHGHNYVLEVAVTGEPDPVTGMIANILDIDAVVEDHILNVFDHKNLNEDVAVLSGKVTTSEIVAQTIFDLLAEQLGESLVRVRLHETARNMFEVSASSKLHTI